MNFDKLYTDVNVILSGIHSTRVELLLPPHVEANPTQASTNLRTQ